MEVCLFLAVPVDMPACCSSVESITRFNWAASAVFGGSCCSTCLLNANVGWIIETTSYRGCFLITSLVYVFATVPILILESLVTRDDQARTPEPAAEQSSSHAASSPSVDLPSDLQVETNNLQSDDVGPSAINGSETSSVSVVESKAA